MYLIKNKKIVWADNMTSTIPQLFEALYDPQLYDTFI